MLIGPLVAAGCAPPPPQEPAPVQKLTTVPPPPANSNPAPQITPASPQIAPTPAGASSDDRIIARINGQPVTLGELVHPLIEAHGLQMLIGLVQLDVLKQEAREEHVVISSEDIQRERDETLRKMFKDADQKEQDQLDQANAKGETEAAQKFQAQIRNDREALLSQYLDNQHFSRTEFELKVEINAYLRKAAERLLQGKITDDMVEKQFGVEYGETAEVRYMQLANMQEAGLARQRLKNGEDFGDVAADMSRNARTRAMKGLMPAFSRQSGGLPESFKELAFSLQPGQVSDTLNFGGNCYIIKLEQKFPPKAVKFDNVKDALRKSMFERLVQGLMEQLNSKLGEQVVSKLEIQDPVLKKQYEQFQAQQQQSAIRDRQKLDDQLKKERPVLSPMTQPATAPAPSVTGPAAATTPAPAPATQP